MPRHLDPARGLIDGGILPQAVEPLVGRRLETEEDVEVPRERPPRLEQLGVARHQIDTALHQNPPLADAAPPKLLRQLQAARRMVPEQIVGDEHMVADRREVAADRVDRPLAHRPGVQLPDRAERAAERAAARGLDEPRGTMRQAGVLPPPRRHVMARRQRHLVERQRPRFAGRPEDPAVAVGQREAGHRRQRRAAFERVAHPRQRALAIVEHDCG